MAARANPNIRHHASMKAFLKRKGNAASHFQRAPLSSASMKALLKRKGNFCEYTSKTVVSTVASMKALLKRKGNNIGFSRNRRNFAMPQ